METARGYVDLLVLDPLRSALVQFMQFAPSLLGALILLLIGGIIAKLIEQLLIRALKVLTLDKLADQVQLSTILVKGGIRYKLSELIGAIVYWIVMLAFVMAALNALNLTQAAELFATIVAFLPNVVAALFILIIGVFAAAFLAAAVRTAASNAGVTQANVLAQFVQVSIIVFAVVAALRQMNIQFVAEAFLIILAGLSLGCALAFGLGCKDIAGRWVSGLIEQIQGRKR